MKVMEGIRGKRGVTLNVQLIDLLSILDEPISDAEKDAKIQSYIENLRAFDSRYKEAAARGPMARYEFAIDVGLTTLPSLNDQQRANVKAVIMNSITDLSVCDKELMEEKLRRIGIDPRRLFYFSSKFSKN